MKDELEIEGEGLSLDPEKIETYIAEINFLDKTADMPKYSQDLAPGEVATNRQTGETYTVESIDSTSGVAVVIDQSGTRRKIHKDYLQRPTASLKTAQDLAETSEFGRGGAPAKQPAVSPATGQAPEVSAIPHGEPQLVVTEPAVIPTDEETSDETLFLPEFQTTITQQFLKEIFTDSRIAPLIIEVLIDKLTAAQIAEALPETTLETIASKGLIPELIKEQGFEIVARLANKLYKGKKL